MKLFEKPVHPGIYVRQKIIPSDMTIKSAAERLGVARSTLSNFLNGKSSLSSKMAARLEKAFGVDYKQLLRLQVVYNQHICLSTNKEITVRSFVPNFLTIKAYQIEEWANTQIDARSHFPVLLRKLVHSTGNEFHKVDFPGYDNSQRKGSDGLIVSEVATPWIPEGNSFWEFGTDQKPSNKAESDYNARVTSVDSKVRSNSTFVFVTPRNWHGKADWEQRKNKMGDWKAVRALDASDLEQWLEQSVPAQIWLAEQLSIPVKGYETLQRAWNRWIHASNPHLTKEIFAPSIASYKDTFKDWLENLSSRPYIIVADSRDEALAFLACLFNEKELRHFKDLTAVFSSPEELRNLISASVPFIPIIHSKEAERELSDAYQRIHCIVIRPRNAVDTEADIKLDRLSYEDFKMALTSMGLDESDIDKLARESGCSPTILRRRLSSNIAIKIPEWADDERAKILVPITLIGTWHVESEADREIVCSISNQKYDFIENEIVHLLQFDDSPVWSVGHYRGITSKIDALFAISKLVTLTDLDRFFIAAKYVLSESDPALELPEKDRWAAAIYNKIRNHSSALRTGICETLVILSVHGNHLFQDRIGIDINSRVTLLIRDLLTPLDSKKLLSQNHDLPRYAEAAPDEFLKIIEEDLKNKTPIVLSLLKPVDSNLFGVSPSRTGLLWALECLAWKPQQLLRVSLILARLSRTRINDNWVNKPENSLKAIFRSWMPQTAATVEQRYKVLERLTKNFPDVVWNICIEQIKSDSNIGHSNYRPNWRSDASGAGQVVTQKKMYDFNRKALDFLIAWSAHDEKSLGDLVETLKDLPEEDEINVWELIYEWSKNANDVAKAELRERIRQFAFTQRSQLNSTIRDRAREVYNILRPQDIVIRHNWLFLNNWVKESVDEISDEDFDYQKREERIDRLRLEAINEIWSERRFEGVKELVNETNAANVIGHYVLSCIIDVKERVDFISKCLSVNVDLKSKFESCLQGFILAIEDDLRTEVLQIAVNELPFEEQIRLFICAPFQKSTWRLLDGFKEEIRKAYWKEVIPTWRRHAPSEVTEIIDSLLEARRPRAAFHAVHIDFKNIETSRLKQLLYDVAAVNNETTDNFQLESYHISKALNSLNGRTGITLDEMAQLEFLFINVLNSSEYDIPNLEAQIAESPVLFVQAIVFAYKRSDEGEDPLEWRITNTEQQAAIATAAHRLLNKIAKIPGTNKNGDIDTVTLTKWLKEVRRLCQEYSRAEIGDQCLGQLLAKAPIDQNGIWPCQEVCEVMDEITSLEIGTGFYVGVLNSRGVHWKDSEGLQERKLATKYRNWAEHLHFQYPYVGAILENIAQFYDNEAKSRDTEAQISKRLHN
ncbi:HigA family addiction module antitoxin [Metasolibacillus meyeri]|uniref:HigA family addiction module antitoxin n=1 Tax=Metasolibacillus meyeri TaxID=1071052 RepID=UPI000D3280E9|nr:HigA family addiction module antitoxin [Metasolibacillus meyeri]